VLVGDAAGYVDALTGEGIAVGLAVARELVDAIVAGDIDRYAARAARVTRRSRLVTMSLLAATRPAAVRARLVPLVARLPTAYAAVASQVAMVPCDAAPPPAPVSLSR
jgi:flavin-dependent dehydrogenase